MVQNCGTGRRGENWTSWLSVDALWKLMYNILYSRVKF